MDITAVIPTCNRKERLLLLLANLRQSALPLREVIIVDSGEQRLSQQDIDRFTGLPIRYLSAQRSVCVQRNTGIREAGTRWIFLCDDDMEVPADYLRQIAAHCQLHPEAGAVSGMVLQKEAGNWQGIYPETSAKSLFMKYIFGLGIWGEITPATDNVIIRRMKRFYQRKGNFLSKAGWPVLTSFDRAFFRTPVYGLGAAVIKKEWLVASPYDEVLDPHGIGDNYGVALRFPAPVHVLPDVVVYHHQTAGNRLVKAQQYFRRMMALHYFIRIKRTPRHVSSAWLAWSLFGQLMLFIAKRQPGLIKPAWKALHHVVRGCNPYHRAIKKNQTVVEPYC